MYARAHGPPSMAGIGCYIVVRIAGDVDLNAFLDQYALLRSKGLSDAAAQQVAQDVIDGTEPPAGMTRRFAAIQGLPYPEAGA